MGSFGNFSFERHRTHTTRPLRRAVAQRCRKLDMLLGMVRVSFFLLFSSWLASAATGPGGETQFQEHVVEPKIPGGYSVMLVDMNHDGKPDIIGLTQRITELAWYENPTWQRHVLVKDMQGLVNMAAADIDGDGIPELGIETGFSMIAAKSEGLVWFLH